MGEMPCCGLMPELVRGEWMPHNPEDPCRTPDCPTCFDYGEVPRSSRSWLPCPEDCAASRIIRAVNRA